MNRSKSWERASHPNKINMKKTKKEACGGDDADDDDAGKEVLLAPGA